MLGNMLVRFVVALVFVAGAVAAQSNFTIDLNKVPITLRASWCNGERNVCKTLCDQNDKVNNCDPASLSYSCVCGANNSAPALELYQNSMPYFICQEAYKECIDANQNNQLGQDNCTNTIKNKCGTLDVANYTAAPVASASATAAASASAVSGSASAPTASATKASAAVAIRMGNHYGSGIIVGAVVVAFGLLL